MGKTSSTVKNRYNLKAYDRLNIVIPKGRKKVVETCAKEKGQSINGAVNKFLQGYVGMTDEEWKKGADHDD